MRLHSERPSSDRRPAGRGAHAHGDQARPVMVRAARLADELGYDVFAVPEGWGLDSTAVLAEIALRTERIGLVSGVLSVWSRTPGTLAMTAATLDQISGGRYVLGLGASTAALTEGFHDVPFVHPADQLAHTLDAVRALLAGEPAHLRNNPDARPLRLGMAPAPTVPIWVAALGPRASGSRPNGRTAGSPRWWLATSSAPSSRSWPPRLRRRRSTPAVHRRRRAAGGGRRGLPGGPGHRGQLHRLVRLAMGDVYAESLTRQGYGAEVAAVRDANPRPRPGTGRIPAAAEALLHQLAATGTREQVRAQLDRWDDIADIVMIGLPPGLPWAAIEATLRAAAPAPERPIPAEPEPAVLALAGRGTA